MPIQIDQYNMPTFHIDKIPSIHIIKFAEHSVLFYDD